MNNYKFQQLKGEIRENNMEKKIKYLVIDVDGTMTDAGIYYDEHGNELKKFCTKDAAGFFAAKVAGVVTIVITGRECQATTRRLEELKVDYVFQNIKNKKQFLQEFMIKNNISKEELGYIGDDLNDFAAMKLAGYVGCPSDSCSEIIKCADYVSSVEGGRGAVRDVIEHIMRIAGTWDDAIVKAYGLFGV